MKRNAPRLIVGLVGVFIFAAQPVSVAMESNRPALISKAELATLDLENAMWRLVHVDEDSAAILNRWRRAGYSGAEIVALQPRLETIWKVPLTRNFGWLHQETIEQIQAVDDKFLSRLRSVRLFHATGIRIGPASRSSIAQVSAQWRREILKVLDYDEISEFVLMNSASAQEICRRTQDIPLNADEQRTLFQWEREFQDQQGSPNVAGEGRGRLWQLEAELNQWERIRELLGDERFVVYLERASATFAEMNRNARDLMQLSSPVTLDLWWICHQSEIARWRSIVVPGETHAEPIAETQARVAALLGSVHYETYARDESSRWLFPAGVTAVVHH